jgi:signal transduction histidine kinase/HPt (histidine-containing phosphotransfer) domain-containing protein
MSKSKKHSLLIVDADTSDLMQLIHILQPEYKLYTAKNGASAIKKAVKFLPNLILLDVILPDMDGFMVLEKLRKSDEANAIPVILITGMSESAGLALGAADFIRKPFDPVAARLRISHQIQIVSLQNDLKQAANAAEMANRAKSSFLANMSHEIRTPMNAILGITDILLNDETITAAAEEGLMKIYSSCDMLLGIINDLLDFSEIEAGKLDIVTAKYHIANLINDSAQLNIMWIEGKPIEFELVVDDSLPAVLVGDELRIRQILSNLLSNAFKYTDSGKVTLSVGFEAEPDSGEIMLLFGVRDTGIGMTKEQLRDLFIEYTRFSDGYGTVEGTRLGLVIARRLLNLMRGEISVDSELGKGSLVTVRLPQKKADDCVLGTEAAENLRRFRLCSKLQNKYSKILRDPMPYGRILIVDDVETNLYVAAGLMNPYKLQLDTAMSGRDAVNIISNGGKYDVIFMDHMMPEMNGMETTKHLRSLGYTDPIIALTANAVVGQCEMFLQNGFDDFISKPIDIRQLDLILNKYVRDKQSPEVIKAARRETGEAAANGFEMAGNAAAALAARLPLWDRKIGGLDMAKGLERCDGNRETYWKILRTYTANIQSLLKSVEGAGKDNLADYIIAVHSIKGASFDVFAEEVAAYAANLEKAATEGDYGYINKHNPVLLETARKLILRIGEAFSALDAINPKPEKDKPDNEALSALLAACRDFDMDGVDAAMDEIDRYQYCEDSGLAVWLRENADMANFEKIADKLSAVGL